MSIDKSLPHESNLMRASGSTGRPNRRLIAFGMVGLIALGAGAAAISREAVTERDTADDDPVVTVLHRVETAVLEPTDRVQQFRLYTGVIAARRTAEIGFERADRLIELSFDEGDAVTAGESLGKLDTRRLEAKRRETVARHQAAVAMLDELVAGPRPETIAAARAQVADLKSQLELRRLTHERTLKLRDQNAATDQDTDDSRLSLKSTEARLNVAEKQLEELVAGTRREQVAAQQANVEQLVAALADIDLELAESVLTAPFDGRIAVRYVDEGTVVSPGQAVFRIVEDGVLEARIGLPLEIVGSLSVGDQVELFAAELRRQGTVARKLPEVDLATRTRTVVIDVNAQDCQTFVPGQVIQTSLPQSIDKTGFLLPTTSLLPGVRGLWSLFVAVPRDDRHVIQRRYVEVLHTSGDQVLVRGTVSAGERVVISGVQRLVHGQLVELAE